MRLYTKYQTTFFRIENGHVLFFSYFGGLYSKRLINGSDPNVPVSLMPNVVF